MTSLYRRGYSLFLSECIVEESSCIAKMHNTKQINNYVIIQNIMIISVALHGAWPPLRSVVRHGPSSPLCNTIITSGQLFVSSSSLSPCNFALVVLDIVLSIILLFQPCRGPAHCSFLNLLYLSFMPEPWHCHECRS